MLKRSVTSTSPVSKCHQLATDLAQLLKSDPGDWAVAANDSTILREVTALSRDLTSAEMASNADVQAALRDSHLLPMLVDLAIHVLEAGLSFKSVGGHICINMLSLCLNATNWSLAFCRHFSQQERFFRVFYSKLLSEQDAAGLDDEDSKTTAIYYSTAIVFNAYFKNDSETFSRLSEYELVDCTRPYLKCKNTNISTAALILIAFAVDEKQADIFLVAQANISFLIDNLTNALKSSDRSYRGYDALEAAKCIRRLALNDANKDLLIELNLLPVVQQMLDSTNDEDIAEGIEILFTLSFSKKSAPKIWSAFQETIVKLQANEKWRQSKQLQGLAFQLAEGQPGRAGSAAASSAGRSRSCRVMISYNHASRQLVDRLYQKLAQAKLDVWVDFKDMKAGSVYQAMASGIEGSSVVLMCITRLYSESSNCRLEVEYAHECGKKLIPLLMEPKYRPSGWLGLLTRAELRYDLTETKGPFEAKVDELLVALRAHLDAAGGGGGNSRPSSSLAAGAEKQRGHGLPSPASQVLPLIATAAASVAAPRHHQGLQPPPCGITLRSWDAERVTAWARESQLPDCIRSRSLTGVELQFLANTLTRSPEYFGRVMEVHFGSLRLLDLATFVAALEDLLAGN